MVYDAIGEGVEIVSYYRVSTAKQGASGLGLDGQVAAVEAFAGGRGAKIVRTFQEVESGRRSDRPELAKAVAYARRAGAVLTIAKLDRLSLNVVFLMTLVESGVDVAFCDLPSVPPGAVGKFILTQMAAVAELEAGLIGERTRSALSAYKSGKRISKRIRLLYPGGVPADVVEATAGKLGASLEQCRNLTAEARVKGAARSVEARVDAAVAAYADLVPFMTELREAGHSLREIARRLNEDGHATRTGKEWGPVQVMRAMARAARG